MSEFSAHHNSHEHDEVSLLLPWYVNQSLETAERKRVESHIRDCLICRREIRSLTDLEAVMENNDLIQISARTSFLEMKRKIEAGKQASSSVVTPITRHPARSNLMRRSIIGLAMAASVVLAVAPFVFHRGAELTPAEFETLSTRTVQSTDEQLQIVFSPNLSATQRNALLLAVGGQLVGEPNSVGAYRIKMHSDTKQADIAAAVTFLRQQPGVLFAEPVQQASADRQP
jgi:hypothetical protein